MTPSIPVCRRHPLQIGLLAVFFAAFGAVLCTAPATAEKMRYQVSDEFTWYHGTPEATMGPADHRVCFLTRIQGHFHGETEAVHARVVDGQWVLSGRSGHGGVGAHARCLTVANAEMYTDAHHWHQGEEPVDLGSAADRACFLTHVQGRFEGGGEQVHVTIQDGRWVLEGASQQSGVGAGARCVLTDRYGDEMELRAGPGMQKMRRKTEGACFLTGIQGRLDGPEDAAGVKDTQGMWHLQSQDPDGLVIARARCID
jgi:hypothetical protein